MIYALAASFGLNIALICAVYFLRTALLICARTRPFDVVRTPEAAAVANAVLAIDPIETAKNAAHDEQEAKYLAFKARQDLREFNEINGIHDEDDEIIMI